jgi:hypothetical protein
MGGVLGMIMDGDNRAQMTHKQLQTIKRPHTQVSHNNIDVAELFKVVIEWMGGGGGRAD